MFYLTTHTTHFYLLSCDIGHGKGPVRKEIELLVPIARMVRWVVGSILHGVDPLNYFSFQPVLQREREREMFYLTTHSTHFIYGYMVSDILLRTILIVRKETRCRHIGYSYRLAARVLLYAPSHRQDNTYHGWNEK